MRHLLFAALFAITAGASALAADMPSSYGPIEANICSRGDALDDIMGDFAWAERRQWHRGFVMQSLENPRPSGHHFNEPGLVKRDYCVADAMMDNGMQFPVYYAIEHGLGFVGLGSNVDFCVLGLDPWHIYDGHCRTVR